MYYFNVIKQVFIAFVLIGFSAQLSAQNQLIDQFKLVESFNQPNQWADSVYSSLSDEEKITQLFMVAAYSKGRESEETKIASLISKYKIGGLIFFQGEVGRQAELTNRYQALSKVPLWIGMDAENGLGSRLKKTFKYPPQIMLGAIQDNQLIYQLGKQIGYDCKRLGVHVNFSPVADINSNSSNPVINSRSFGEDRENVSVKSYLLGQGLQNAGVLAVGKHFPGHGDTDVDSHMDLPLISHSRARLDSVELYSFRRMIDCGIGGIMVSHLNVPALDAKEKVATLSYPIVTDLLKNELNFKGLIFTDALNMKGIRKYYKKGELDAKALMAGNDVLLFTEDVPLAIKEIKKAIANQQISWGEIEAKCKKILKAKYWLGLHRYQPVVTDKLWSGLNRQQSFILRKKLCEQAITLVKNKDDFLPLKRLDTLKIASVAIGASIRNRFQTYLGRYTNIAYYQIAKNAPQQKFDELYNKLKKYNLIVVSKHDSDLRASRKFGVTKQSTAFLNKIAQHKKVIFDLFASPYALKYYKNHQNIKSILVSYQDSRDAQMASAQIIFGGLPALGRLPVSVGIDFPAGIGYITKRNRLGYAIPEQVGLRTLGLHKIDSIVKDAIKQKAAPGCQVVVARRGKVVFEKSYGYHTYKKKRAVRNPDLYDMASLTKAAASLPSIMKLYDEGKIDIKQNLGRYLSKAKASNKDTIQLKRILAHQARLLAWKPFNWETVDSASFDKNLFHRRYSKRYSLKVGKNQYLDRNYRFTKGIYSKQKSKQYPVQVAKGMYINKNYHDTIVSKILHSDFREKEEYKYSDFGFILFGDLIQEQSGLNLHQYTKRSFYRSLGAISLGYLPLKRFSADKIVPTENDQFFRKQFLRGYVHDPTCAMLGGISGHAGLFGNAHDLAKLVQMYLQEGTYGGERYISKKIMNLFTSRAFPDGENRRGLGFDKPFLDPDDDNGPTCSQASPSSYGHTGFTGTMFWVDPEYDLLYIFLSNRICPDASNSKLLKLNVRTKIQECIYKSIQSDVNLENEQTLSPVLPYGKWMFN